MNRKTRIQELKQLEKILRVREQRAVSAYKTARGLLQEIEERKSGYADKLQHLDEDLDSVAAFKNSLDTITGAKNFQDAQNFRRWIVYDQEETSFYHDKAVGDLASQQEECAKLRKTMIKADRKHKEIQELLLREKSKQSQHEEELSDVELEDTLNAFAS